MKVIDWLLVLLLSASPVASAQSMRCDTLHTIVNFRKGYSVLDSDYMDNGTRLRRLSDRIAELRDDSIMTIERVCVRGAASPDGYTDRNLALSRKRARTIADYLSHNTPLPDSIFTVEAAGIDWAQLEAMVDTSSMPHREEVLEILRTVPQWVFEGNAIVDSRKRRLGMLHGGRPYNYMATHFFPAMRQACFITEVCMTERAVPATQPDTTSAAPAPPSAPSRHDDAAPAPDRATSADAVPAAQPAAHPFHFALKTNMLYDAAAVPNIGLEIAIGRKWSLTANGMLAWWSRERSHYYYRFRGGEVEARRWWTCPRPGKGDGCLTGHHLGLYAQLFDYDIELGGTGRQSDGPCFGAGISYGYSLPVSRLFCIDFTVGIGWIGGQYRKYRPADGCYVWQSTVRHNWFGPTKAEISLVYKLGGKGGRR